MHRFLFLSVCVFFAGLLGVSAQEQRGNQPETDRGQSAQSGSGVGGTQNENVGTTRDTVNNPAGNPNHGSGGIGTQGSSGENKGGQSGNAGGPSGSDNNRPQDAGQLVVLASKNSLNGKMDRVPGGASQLGASSKSQRDTKVKGKYNGKGNAKSWTPEKWTPQKLAEMKQRMMDKNKVYGGGQERGGPPWMRVQGGTGTLSGSGSSGSIAIERGIEHQQFRAASSLKIGRLPIDNSGAKTLKSQQGRVSARGLSAQLGRHSGMQSIGGSASLGGLLSGMLSRSEFSRKDLAPGSRSREFSSRSNHSLNSSSRSSFSRSGYSRDSKSAGIAPRNDRFKRVDRGNSSARGVRSSGTQTGVCPTGTLSLRDIMFGAGSSGQSNQRIASSGGRSTASRSTASRSTASRSTASRSTSRGFTSGGSRSMGSTSRRSLTRDSRASGAPSKGLTSRAGITMGSTRHGNVSSGSRSMGSTSRGFTSGGSRSMGSVSRGISPSFGRSSR